MTIAQTKTHKIKELKNFIRSGGYVWPGGYQAILLMSNGECIDAMSARENYKLIRRAIDSDFRDEWTPEGVFIHYEGAPLYCALSGRKIESAYDVED